jgi:phosphohistidine phosphatase SixA
MAQGAGETALVAALRAGGHVAVLRHGITDRSQADRGDLADRAGQRNLSAAGRAQAERIGRAFAVLGVPVGEVLTSPVFRARDTAELAFGARARVEPHLIADDYEPDPARMAAHVTSAAGATDVLVGHIVPLGMVLGRGLAQAEYPEGSLALFAPGEGQGRLLGILKAEELAAAAGLS